MKVIFCPKDIQRGAGLKNVLLDSFEVKSGALPGIWKKNALLTIATISNLNILWKKISQNF